ncbi:MAG: translation elongation factor Ts [Holophagales bacterium]|nr:translation elongation factor Ts [Holophagales bacterium]MYG30401.1 translation elongation factor Ts [Holophagales bacterium]MYI81447.1 translation elongation factor Ts [Holophagales bacterium]
MSATVTAAMVKELRERTGAGMMDCKKALVETGGDLEASIDALRKKGLASAAKKAGRATSDGLVISYIHAGGKIGVLLEINCETDFVARTDDFQQLAHDLSLHVAASQPRFIGRDEVTDDVLDREKRIHREQALESGKPEQIVERIVEGRMSKFFAENCLLEQPFVKDTGRTVEEVLKEAIAKLGENMRICRFARFQLGGDSTVATASQPPADPS